MLKDGLTNLMKQAQAMQGEVAKMQKEISALEVVGEAGGGMVTVRMNGRKDVLAVKIESKVVTEDLEMFQDLLVIAFNDASKRADAVSREKMSKATPGLGFLKGFN